LVPEEASATSIANDMIFSHRSETSRQIQAFGWTSYILLVYFIWAWCSTRGEVYLPSSQLICLTCSTVNQCMMTRTVMWSVDSHSSAKIWPVIC